eukprot:scaffold648383_cov51-Prasinocladus_malaysianus.AAC.1
MAPVFEQDKARFEALLADARRAYKEKYGDLPEGVIDNVQEIKSAAKELYAEQDSVSVDSTELSVPTCTFAMSYA